MVFSEMLDEASWMDPTTRSEAHEKLKNMIAMVAYPDFLMNNTLVDRFYSGVRSF